MSLSKAANTIQNTDELITLQKIAEGTASSLGTNFFRALVKNLCETIGIHAAWVTELLEKERRLRALSFCAGGRFVEHYEYDIAGTPCEPVISCPDIFHVPEKVIELFPKDPDLAQLGAVSYMGVALKDIDGKIIGHLAVLDNKPMRKRPRIISIFKIFAARAAAELQRIRAENKILESEERLNRLVNGTYDAICEMNEKLELTQVNSAAQTLFELSPETIPGFSMKHLLNIEGFKKFTEALYHVKEQVNNVPYYWIQGYTSCRTAKGKDFPGEATLTMYSGNKENYYVFVVRNAQRKLEAEEKIRSLNLETILLKEEIKNIFGLDEIAGSSPEILAAMKAVQQVAAMNTTVLIQGETGTGKELFARAIHKAGNRSGRPMVKLNCAALPATLIESELFGHEKGAFTGASAKREGRFLLADGGTLFLDEIGELPLELQAKLLRVLQEGEFEPIGSNKTIKVDVRIIAATNRELSEEVKQGKFREDLFYRLNVFPIHIPALRQRGNDIIHLAEIFVRQFARQMKKEGILSTVNKQNLLNYHWPGNVRELQNVMERAVITSENGRLDFILKNEPHNREGVHNEIKSGNKILTDEEIKRIEKDNILHALALTNWQVSGANGAAALLQMPPTTLCSRIKSLNIKR